MPTERTIRVFPSPQVVASAAADLIVQQAARSIESTGRFSLTLSGGSTPKILYELLAAEPYRSNLDWTKIEIFFGDERCVPPDNEQSNYRMANEALLSKVPLRSENIHRMHGETDPEAAAIEYGRLLKAKFGDAGPDLILLGMGPDGHTASLFPETSALDEQAHRCVANYVPKFSAWRLTMTAPFINRAHCIAALIAGAEKGPIVKQVLEQPPDAVRFPIQLIQPSAGQFFWFLDAAAAGMD
ncbi:MAG TPA: 6-phosphogluconolactonase [Tepidisphaeraceae bacterium]|nr:6-phosphogluconolactonase [Tepidisphaeraceae bacterium]